MPAAEAATDPESALAKAIESAEDALKQMRLSDDASVKKLWSSRAKTYLLEAEKLKAQTAQSKGPTTTRQLPKSEQILLLKASFVDGQKYPPWSQAPSSVEFDLEPGSDPYTDLTPFSLSSSQQEVFNGWQRPSTALSGTTMVHQHALDLVQDASTDCSVVASLCAGIARQKLGHAKLTSQVIHPWNNETDCPQLSPNGKYIIRLNFNGCFRRVVIDDRLPTSKTERYIHVIDRQNPGLLWPALIEKAYLKLRGGYDFPGSNSATDLWCITGWIPEQVFLQTEDLDLNQVWSSMAEGWSNGDVLITMGTGKMSERVEREVGLAGQHDYAVLDLQEIRGQRLLLVKNPWCEGSNWHELSGISSPDMLAAAQSPRDLLNADAQLSPGTFWMDIDNVAQYFESIYLNWNPGLFNFRQDLHFSWDLSSTSQHSSVHSQPQFRVSLTQGGTIWLLLCRHLDKTNETARSTAAADLDGFISLSAHAAAGKRIKLSGKIMERSAIVDSPQILLKVDGCTPGQVLTVVAVEHELSRKAHTFTISAFSRSELLLDHALPTHSCSCSVSGSWTRDTAGGNANHLSYGSNPQFSISLKQGSRVSVLLQARKDDLNVHIKLVHGNGKRVRAVRNRDVVVDSGDYRRRSCLAESKGLLTAGTYTIICSTFEPGHVGQFELLVESDIDVTLSPIARDGAGRLTMKATSTLAAGITQVAATLLIHRPVNISAIASIEQDAERSTPHLRLSIEQGTLSHRRIIMASDDDDFAATRPGPARIDELDLSPDIQQYGQLWLVLSRVCAPERAIRQSANIELLVDQSEAVQLGQWTQVTDWR